MQRNRFVSTSLLVAALAVVVLVGDSMAGPLGLFGRRNRDNNNGSAPMTYSTPVAQAPVDGQPAQPAQPVAQPAQPTTTTAQPITTQGQYSTQRRGLFGRRTAQVWEPTVTQVAMQQPQAQQPQPGAQPMPAAEVAPMPSAVPTAGIAPTTQPQVVTERRGILGRRTSQRIIDQPAPGVATTQPGTSRQAFYPAGGQVGYIEVRVPVANAEVIVNDARTTQQGISRLFVTPVLDPQRENLYVVKAKFTGRDGNPIEQTKEVKVPAGQRITVDFSAQQ
ncbi:hypothetical protein AYO44_11720 [Planctomycetaceae bacterium SCGC AG-212-F19]|nr:hypothetical protein AYO44_11720 [Planctomycetaceae bacterium SCGC AG-212-F19]